MNIGVIPTRFGSTRLMGKPLADIGGKPMIQHTYESVKKSKLLHDVIIAVDDEKLYEIATGFGANVIMTPQDIKTGSDRIAYIVKGLPKADIIVNIQGDEPFIKGKMIDEAIEPLLFDKKVNVATLARRITSINELKSEAIPKVVFDYNNYALYFSRSPIPFVREARTDHDKINRAEIYKHIGLYVYRKNTLLKFTSLKPTDLELTENLEQLRMIENGIKIKIVVTDYDCISVDTPEDLERARKYYEKFLMIKE
jgi:3-deoxy-manno-octulosonate cytidylyltransferase (CMP-KDO synthetase)